MFCLFHKKSWHSVSVDASGQYIQRGWCKKCGKAFWRYV